MTGIAVRMAGFVGAANVVTDPAELLVYEADGLTHGRKAPAMVVLPGVDGELGILPRHQPLVTLLAIGETRIRTVTGDWDYIATGIGFVAMSVTSWPRRCHPR